MFNKQSQFINVIKYDAQLKIDYKKLINNEMEISDQATFLLHDNILSKDIIFKIDTYKEEILNTYTTTLSINSEEKLIKKNTKIDSKDDCIAKLNENLNLSLKKTKIFELEHYFKKIPLDYIFSPFHIINMHLEQKPTSSGLINFVINNYCYVVIVNEKSKIDFYKVYKISTFSKIKESTFFQSEIEGQKLYDEIYLLELTDIIKNALKEYYSKQKQTFVNNITVLYYLKQLEKDQVAFIEDELLIDVNYHYISISDSLYELSRRKDSNSLSYIERKPKRRSFFKAFVISSLLIIIACLGYIFNDRYVELQKNSNIIKKGEIKELKRVKLPNHIYKNTNIQDELNLIFDSLPYTAVLKNLKLMSNESILICDLLNSNSFFLNMQASFLTYYKKSEIKFTKRDTIIKNAVILNQNRISIASRLHNDYPLYKHFDFMPIKRVSEYLIELLPENSTLEYKSKFKSELITYNYKVEFKAVNPTSIFDFIDKLNKLNKLNYSINISYPLEMKKTKTGILVSFNLQFHQTL